MTGRSSIPPSAAGARGDPSACRLARVQRAQPLLTARGESRSRQSLLVITGQRAPQRFRFDVALPPGSSLSRRGRHIVAVTGEGEVSGALQAPWAVDARGIEVSTRFEVIDRDSFVQVVEHRPVATYPVVADPWWVVPVLVREGGRLLGRYVVRRATYGAAKRAATRMAARQSDFDVDELLARSPRGLLPFTSKNFRENVRRRTGWRKSSIPPYDAHHTLPKKFASAFRTAGLNIHNPIFGHWWCRPAHRSFARRYNARWEGWLEPRRANIRNTNAWRNRIERKRIAMVSSSTWASTYQCP